MDRALALEKAREVLDIEIAGIAQIRDSLGDSFLELVETIIELIHNGGKIVVTGVGKSGHIGKKMAASLASTGSTAIFLHPVEAMHGDLGMIQEGDLLLALSYSGETDELLHVILPAKRLGVKIASFSGEKTYTRKYTTQCVRMLTSIRHVSASERLILHTSYKSSESFGNSKR